MHVITHEAQDEESLSIEKNEKELILRALEKNNNKRKICGTRFGNIRAHALPQNKTIRA